MSTAGSSLVLAGLAALPALLLIAPLHAASVLFPRPSRWRAFALRAVRDVAPFVLQQTHAPAHRENVQLRDVVTKHFGHAEEA